MFESADDLLAPTCTDEGAASADNNAEDDEGVEVEAEWEWGEEMSPMSFRTSLDAMADSEMGRSLLLWSSSDSEAGWGVGFPRLVGLAAFGGGAVLVADAGPTGRSHCVVFVPWLT